MIEAMRAIAVMAVALAILGLAAAADEPGTLTSEEHGIDLILPEGWEPIPLADIPAAGRQGLIFAVQQPDEGATLMVKSTTREAREGEGKRVAQLLKRKGGIAEDGQVLLGGKEGWRIVRLTEEDGQPLMRSTIFLPHRGMLYMITENKVGSTEASDVQLFQPVEAAMVLAGDDVTRPVPSVPVDLPGGVHVALPEGWQPLTEIQVSELPQEKFGDVESAYFSPRQDWLFYVSHVGDPGIIYGPKDLEEIGEQFQAQLDSLAGAQVIARRDETIAERPIHRVVYEIASLEGGKLYESRLLTARDGQLVYIGGLALQAGGSDALQTFDPIFASVRIDAPAFARVEALRAAQPTREYPKGRGLFPRAFPEKP